MADSWAAKYVGIPYVVGGDDETGCDCWGLINLVWRREKGSELPTYDGRRFHSRKDRFAVYRGAVGHVGLFEPVPHGEERAFDGVLIRQDGLPTHCGIIVEPGKIMHTDKPTDVVIEPYPSLRFRGVDLLLGFYRPKTT